MKKALSKQNSETFFPFGSYWYLSWSAQTLRFVQTKTETISNSVRRGELEPRLSWWNGITLPICTWGIDRLHRGKQQDLIKPGPWTRILQPNSHGWVQRAIFSNTARWGVRCRMLYVHLTRKKGLKKTTSYVNRLKLLSLSRFKPEILRLDIQILLPPNSPTYPLNNDGLEDDFPFENASIRKAEKTPSFSTREPAPACAARLSACDQRQKHYVTPRFRPAPWEGLGLRLRLRCTLVFLEILIWDTSCLDLLGTKLLGFQPDLKFQMEKM